MYLNNGSFKSEVDPHQFNLRERKKIFKSWQVCDWLAKWLIVLGFMDLRWPRVYRRSNVGLVTTLYFYESHSLCLQYQYRAPQRQPTTPQLFLYILHMCVSILRCLFNVVIVLVFFSHKYNGRPIARALGSGFVAGWKSDYVVFVWLPYRI